MELWYSIVELLPFSWAAEGSMYFMTVSYTHLTLPTKA